ncbi:MAG: hypothetical protein DMF70_02450, partial [Acidobacteria bacterium]
LPGLAFALLIGFVSWSIQERVMPEANVRQDNLRAKIKGISAQLASGSERRWLVSADGARIFSYEFDDQRQLLLKPAIYDFDPRGVELTRVISGEAGKWLTASDMEISGAHWINLDAPQVSQQSAETMRISGVDPPAVFRPTVDRPSQLSAERLRSYIQTLKQRGAETAPLAVALQRKYAAPFSVIVMALVGMPLAISFGRKTTVLASTVGRTRAVASGGGRVDASRNLRRRRAVFYLAGTDVSWSADILVRIERAARIGALARA